MCHIHMHSLKVSLLILSHLDITMRTALHDTIIQIVLGVYSSAQSILPYPVVAIKLLEAVPLLIAFKVDYFHIIYLRIATKDNIFRYSQMTKKYKAKLTLSLEPHVNCKEREWMRSPYY